MEKNTISKATLGRLPQYLGLLRTLPQGEDDRISATAIARRLSLGEVFLKFRKPSLPLLAFIFAKALGLEAFGPVRPVVRNTMLNQFHPLILTLSL